MPSSRFCRIVMFTENLGRTSILESIIHLYRDKRLRSKECQMRLHRRHLWPAQVSLSAHSDGKKMEKMWFSFDTVLAASALGPRMVVLRSPKANLKAMRLKKCCPVEVQIGGGRKERFRITPQRVWRSLKLAGILMGLYLTNKNDHLISTQQVQRPLLQHRPSYRMR